MIPSSVPIKYLSPSTLNHWQSCPKKFEYLKVWGMESQNEEMKEKLYGRGNRYDKMLRLVIEAQENVFSGQDSIVFDLMKKKMFSYILEPRDGFETSWYTQKELKGEIAGFPCLGFADVLIEYPERVVILDLKTAAKPWPVKPILDNQPLMYHELAEQVFKKPTVFEYLVLVFDKKKGPYWQENPHFDVPRNKKVIEDRVRACFLAQERAIYETNPGKGCFMCPGYGKCFPGAKIDNLE